MQPFKTQIGLSTLPLGSWCNKSSPVHITLHACWDACSCSRGCCTTDFNQRRACWQENKLLGVPQPSGAAALATAALQTRLYLKIPARASVSQAQTGAVAHRYTIPLQHNTLPSAEDAANLQHMPHAHPQQGQAYWFTHTSRGASRPPSREPCLPRTGSCHHI